MKIINHVYLAVHLIIRKYRANTTTTDNQHFNKLTPVH